MENASKALIMAASVLLGIMLISIGVYLFSIFGDYSAEMYAKIERAQIDQYNAQFLKYYGTRANDVTGLPEQILCTAHDIASLANLAKQNNLVQQIQTPVIDYSSGSYANKEANTLYVQIKVIGETNATNLETWTESNLLNFIQKNALHNVYRTGSSGETLPQEKNYICTQAKVSSLTKRIYYMEFIHKNKNAVGAKICTCH